MNKYITLENSIYEAYLVLNLNKINDELVPPSRKKGGANDKNNFYLQSAYLDEIKRILPLVYKDYENKATAINEIEIKNYFGISQLLNDIDVVNKLIEKNRYDEKSIDKEIYKNKILQLSKDQGLLSNFYIKSKISNAGTHGISFKKWNSDFNQILKPLLFHYTNIKVYLFQDGSEVSAFWEIQQDNNLYNDEIIDNMVINNENQDPFNYKTFHDSATDSCLMLSEKLVLRFISSLCSKPFVILSGLSGSGKTKIAQSFVQWICQDNTQYKIIPVGADWTNREPLVGYPNGLVAEEYITPDSGVIHLLLEAIKDENENKPFFLILDEMNLSHVERYFADFLSIMESNDTIKLYTGNKRKCFDDLQIPLEIGWPKNVFIIGTVNIDETTYMFSPKVLDRANVIEFRITDDEIKDFLTIPGILDLKKLKGQGIAMAESFLSIAAQTNIVQNDDIAKELVSFFKQLQYVGAEFGYRSATEIMQLAAKLRILEPRITDDECLDIAIMQKLLPKLHGSRSKLVKILIALSGLCVEDITKEEFEKKFEDLHKNGFDGLVIKYPISFEKLIRMYKNVLANGFTSYAEA